MNGNVKHGMMAGRGARGQKWGRRPTDEKARRSNRSKPMADPTYKIEIEHCETGYFFTIKRGEEPVCSSRRDYADVAGVKMALVEMITAFTEDNFDSFDLT